MQCTAQFAAFTALREEHAGLFAWMPVGSSDLCRIIDCNDLPFAVASFVFVSVCEGAQLSTVAGTFSPSLMLCPSDAGSVPAKRVRGLIIPHSYFA
jgi:hypothetical protein